MITIYDFGTRHVKASKILNYTDEVRESKVFFNWNDFSRYAFAFVIEA